MATTARNSHKFVTEVATRCHRGWSNRNKVRFHCFNEAGFIAEKRRLNDTIREHVNEHGMRSGWHLAYGSFNDFHVKELYKLLEKKRVTDRELSVTLEMFRDHLSSAWTAVHKWEQENLNQGNTSNA